MLTQERLKEILSYDPKTGIFAHNTNRSNCVKIGSIAGCINFGGYRAIVVNCRSFLAHRLAWFYIYGQWPNKNIDHINGLRDDNRLSNLREASQSENLQNQHNPGLSNKSGYLGVHFRKDNGRWVAQITVNRKRKHLGCFLSPELASMAYLDAKRKLHPYGQI